MPKEDISEKEKKNKVARHFNARFHPKYDKVREEVSTEMPHI